MNTSDELLESSRRSVRCASTSTGPRPDSWSVSDAYFQSFHLSETTAPARGCNPRSVLSRLSRPSRIGRVVGCMPASIRRGGQLALAGPAAAEPLFVYRPRSYRLPLRPDGSTSANSFLKESHDRNGERSPSSIDSPAMSRLPKPTDPTGHQPAAHQVALYENHDGANLVLTVPVY